MALLNPSEPWTQTAEGAALRRSADQHGRPGLAARSELALRFGMEDLLRSRMPEARMCHEMVMGAGKVRADLVAVGTDHIAAIEVKGAYDDTSRLLHQIGMYQLCVPEVWMVVDAKHRDDAALIRFLLPGTGLIVADGLSHLGHDWNAGERPATFEVVAEPVPRPPVPKMMLEMLWADELRACCGRMSVAISSKAVRAAMISQIMRLASAAEILPQVCTALRGRDALWRADAPIRAVR